MPANPHSNLPELNYYRSTFCTFNFMASLTFNLTKFEKTSIAGDQRKKWVFALPKQTLSAYDISRNLPKTI